MKHNTPLKGDGSRWTQEEYEKSVKDLDPSIGFNEEYVVVYEDDKDLTCEPYKIHWASEIKLDHKPDGLFPKGPIELPGFHKAKFDKGKPMMSLVEPEFIIGMAKVMTMGAKKYSAGSWKEVPDAKRRYKDALLRHLYAEEEKDTESGLSHLLHAACNVMFLYYLETKDE